MRLVADLARMTHAWDTCVDVVFEGPAPPGWLDGSLIAGVRVWFAGVRPVSERIAELAALEMPEDPAFVVTDDADLATRARATGGSVIRGSTLRRALDRVCGSAYARVGLRSPLLCGPEALVGMGAA